MSVRRLLPVNCDRTQMLDAGGTAHHVARDEEVAEEGAKRPLTQVIVDDRQGHHKKSYRYVGNGQTVHPKKSEIVCVS
jgi:hypothetical protein